MDVTYLKQEVDESVEQNIERIWKIACEIYKHPEPAFNEYYSLKILTDFLEEKSFSVHRNVGDLPTAFVAEYRNGKGPVIGVFAEYDCVPGMGHACGHNLIAANAVGTAVVLKEIMGRYGLAGTIKVLGSPAEEDGGGKVIMQKAHAFDDLDVAFLMHPTSAMTRIGGSCASFSEFFITYKGKSAQAESHPDKGINAFDAASLFHVAVGLQRQELSDTTHISDVVVKMSDYVGQIPDFAKLDVEVNSIEVKDIPIACKRIRDIAQGVALCTGCEYDIEELVGYLGRVPNAVLGDYCRKELIHLGEPCMEGFPIDAGAEDFGNVSFFIPCCNLFMSIYPKKKIAGHTQLFQDLAGADSSKEKLETSIKAIGRTIIELLLNPEIIADAKDELKFRLENLK